MPVEDSLSPWDDIICAKWTQLSRCGQLVIGLTHERGGTLDLLMTDVPNLVSWYYVKFSNKLPIVLMMSFENVTIYINVRY